MTLFDQAREALRSQIDFLRYNRRGLPIGAQRDALSAEIGKLKSRLKFTDEQWLGRRRKVHDE